MMENFPQVVEDVLFWAAASYGVLVVLSDSLRAVAEELEDAAERTEVEWDNKLAAGLRAFQQGLARVLVVVGNLVPRIKSRRGQS